MTSRGAAECGAAAICSLHPKIDPIAMPPKAKTPWQPAHGLEYALEVVSIAANSDITVRCMFCVYEGRDSIVVDGSSTRKRKLRNDIKYFLKPFLPHKYRSHHDGQHVESWALYKAAAKKDKQHFFDNKIKVANTLHRYMDLDNNILTFMINANIMNMIISDMFFRDDEVVVDSDDADDDDDDLVGTTAKKAANKLKENTNGMKLFILNEVDEDEDDLHSYTVTINNIMRFNLAMDHVGNGMSFRHTTSAIQHAKEGIKTTKLASITDLMVGSTLQQIADCLDDESVWAMSLAGDSSTHRGQSFFDLCVYICFRGRLLNLHLVVIPMFDRHTAGNIFNMLVKFLDALYGKWRAKLIGMSSDEREHDDRSPHRSRHSHDRLRRKPSAPHLVCTASDRPGRQVDSRRACRQRVDQVHLVVLDLPTCVSQPHH